MVLIHEVKMKLYAFFKTLMNVPIMFILWIMRKKLNIDFLLDFYTIFIVL